VGTAKLRKIKVVYLKRNISLVIHLNMEDLTMNQIAYLYVLDSMADWETGFLIAELNSGRYFRKNATQYTVKTVGLTEKTIVTMGGIQILPDISVHTRFLL
jgi:hypothetical protein